MAKIDLNDILKELGFDPSTMTDEELAGAQQALGDIICSRGEEEELGLSLDASQNGAPIKPDPRLNVPKIKQPSMSTDNSNDNNSSDSSGSGGDSDDEENVSAEPAKSNNDNTDDNQDADSADDRNNEEDSADDSEEDASNSSVSNDDGNDSEDTDEEDVVDSDADDEISADEDSEDEDAIDDTSEEEDSEEEDSEDASSDEEDSNNSDEAEDDWDDLEDINDPDSLDMQKQERKHRIGRLRRVLDQTEDAINGVTTESLLRENKADDLKRIAELRKKLDDAEDLTDEEFEAIEDEILELSNRHIKLSITSKEEKEKKLQRIQDEINDQKVLDDLEAEDIEHKRKEHKQLSDAEKRRQQYRGVTSFGGFAEFKNSLFKAMARQVTISRKTSKTWSRPNKRNTDPTVVKKGEMKKRHTAAIPSIDFYFDQSGSWTKADIETGARAVAMLQDMERKKQLTVNVYYFSDDITTDPHDSCLDQGTTAWPKIIQNIKETGAKNVVIMTDDDMGRLIRYHGNSYSGEGTVPGYVWYLWKNGERAPELPKLLKGKYGTLEFTFQQGDA